MTIAEEIERLQEQHRVLSERTNPNIKLGMRKQNKGFPNTEPAVANQILNNLRVELDDRILELEEKLPHERAFRKYHVSPCRGDHESQDSNVTMPQVIEAADHMKAAQALINAPLVPKAEGVRTAVRVRELGFQEVVEFEFAALHS